MTDPSPLEQSYDAYERVEDDFLAELDRSLGARGSDMLFDLVAGLGLPEGARVLDVGSGRGRQAVRLAERFGFVVTGVDPVRYQIAMAEVEKAAVGSPGLRERVRFEQGTAEALPVDDASVDLVWSKDVFGLVADLERAYAEIARVLRPGGRAVVYQSGFATDRLDPEEAEIVWGGLDIVRANADPTNTEGAIAAAGLRVDECMEVGIEWGEHAEEHNGTGGRRLLHAARLLRDPDRYIAKFGRTAYEIMYADCLWHVYRMLGKLGERVYVLSRP